MPTYPLNRDNAWNAWTKGKVKGVNAYVSLAYPDVVLKTQDTRTVKTVNFTVKEHTLANQAISQGMNSVRLWLSGWTRLCDMQFADWDNVGDAGLVAPAGSSGWDSKVPLVSSSDKSMATLADYAAMVTGILDQCERLGLGVILTGYYGYHQQGAEVRNLWAEPGNYAREHLGLFWVEVMKKWGRHKAIIGLDILNEPSPPRPAGGYGPAAWRHDPSGWPTLAQDVVGKIRAVEAQLKLPKPMPIIVEVAGDESTIRMFDPYTPGAGGDIIQDPAGRIVYSLHHYSPWPVTHQGISEDNWANLGRVYGKTVARGVEGGFDAPYDITTSVTDGWGRAKGLTRDEQSLTNLWRHAIDFRDNAAAAGHPIALYVGEFAHIHPDVDQVEPADPNRSYLIDPSNGVPAFRVAENSERYRHPVFSPTHITGGWTKQNPSRWVTRFEPFTATNGQKKVRLYFDNLDRLLFGRTNDFQGLTASELGSLANQIVDGAIGGGLMVIDPLVPSPRPDAILEKICKRDPVTGQILKDQIDRSKVPLRYRSAMGFPITTKVAEPGDDRSDQNALEWPLEKFTNTLLLDVIGPEGEIIKGAKVTIALDQFWIEVDAAAIKIAAYQQAVELDAGSMIDGQYFRPRAVAVFSSATPNAEMEAGRDQFIADTLAVCRRHGISWSFLDAGTSSIGPIGWRASAASMRRLKADCER